MKKKGRFVLEACFLVPAVCLLLVYAVFFTMYAHDYAVCANTALESGVKGTYRDRRPDLQIETEVRREIQQKLSERLLWMQHAEVEVNVNPVQLVIRISGKGGFLPVKEIQVQRKIIRTDPCGSVRRSRWLRGTGGGEHENTI